MIIIPAMDIINGQVVRLSGGDFGRKKVYDEDYLLVAKKFEDAGLKRLHIVDLDGAKNKSVTNIRVLEKVAATTSLAIDFGGGVTSAEDVQRVFDAGASQCTIGSIAARSPDILAGWIGRYGAKKFLIGADVLNEKIRISGWLEDGGMSLSDFLMSMTRLGSDEFFCTDISRDGMMQGPSTALYRKVLREFPGINLIASGGVATLHDLRELKEAGCAGAIVGKAIYEETISLKELSEFS